MHLMENDKFLICHQPFHFIVRAIFQNANRISENDKFLIYGKSKSLTERLRVHPKKEENGHSSIQFKNKSK